LLTVKQALTFTTRRAVPPWNISEWRVLFNIGRGQLLSVRTLIDEIENRKLLLFLEARGLSLIRNTHSLSEVLAQWKDAPGPTRTDLQALVAQLSPHGVFIKFLSKDRRIIGLSGALGQLDGVQGIRLTDHVVDGVRDIATGAIELGAVIFAIGAVPEPASPILLTTGAVIGAVGIGMEFGLGIFELTQPEPGQTLPQKETISDTDVYGQVPPGIDASQVIDLGDIDVIDLGDLPEDPPPPDAGGAPGVPGPGAL
jgi:hypothetical protein